MKLDIDTFIDLIGKARVEERDKLLHDEWAALLPYMYTGYLKQISFTEYVDRRTGRNIDWRPADVILAEIEELEKEFDQ